MTRHGMVLVAGAILSLVMQKKALSPRGSSGKSAGAPKPFRRHGDRHARALKPLKPVQEVVPTLELNPVTGPFIATWVDAARRSPFLCAALDRAAARVSGRADAPGPARLHIDRAFTIRGAGTVVTGTLWSGRLAAGDRVERLPSGVRARVRAVQVHDQPVELAVAGQRVAVNLTGVAVSEVARGDVLVTPDPTRFWDESRSYINHSDHRTVGQACMAVVNPDSSTQPMFPELLDEGFEPH